jgi:hypothetical protein
VLVGVGDVEPGSRQKAADRGDQARAVRAGEQQAGVLLVGDRQMIATSAAANVRRSRR